MTICCLWDFSSSFPLSLSLSLSYTHTRVHSPRTFSRTLSLSPSHPGKSFSHQFRSKSIFASLGKESINFSLFTCFPPSDGFPPPALSFFLSFSLPASRWSLSFSEQMTRKRLFFTFSLSLSLPTHTRRLIRFFLGCQRRSEKSKLSLSLSLPLSLPLFLALIQGCRAVAVVSCSHRPNGIRSYKALNTRPARFLFPLSLPFLLLFSLIFSLSLCTAAPRKHFWLYRACVRVYEQGQAFDLLRPVEVGACVAVIVVVVAVVVVVVGLASHRAQQNKNHLSPLKSLPLLLLLLLPPTELSISSVSSSRSRFCRMTTVCVGPTSRLVQFVTSSKHKASQKWLSSEATDWRRRRPHLKTSITTTTSTTTLPQRSCPA